VFYTLGGGGIPSLGGGTVELLKKGSALINYLDEYENIIA
jgi:hypothetical protein